MNFKYLISKVLKKIHIPAIKNSDIHKKSKVSSASHIVDTNIKEYSYVGNSCTIINTNIGKFCSIADNCIIGGASHPIKWVSTSPVFHDGKNILKSNISSHEYKVTEKTLIGNDVWIGNNCLIKSGVIIGNGSVIGMGSIVTKNVGSYEIWAGNPAKLIKKRFNEETANLLDKSQWWNYDENELLKKAKLFNDINAFEKELRKL